MKQALFQNSGYEELSYQEILKLSSLKASNIIVKHNSKHFIPRKITKEFIDAIHTYSPEYDNLLYTLAIEQPVNIDSKLSNKRFYFSPSNTMIAMLQNIENEDDFRKILGSEDSINQDDRSKIDMIINVIKSNKEYIQRKRMDNILNKTSVMKAYFNGNSVNAKIESKLGNNIYHVNMKKPILFENNKITIDSAIQYNCSCGFNQFSILKYEYNNITSICSHLELLRMALSNPQNFQNIVFNQPITKLNNLFSPFSPLDYPMKYKKIRDIIREALYLYLVPQIYIKQFYNDSNDYHRRNGFTLFRCELDLFLLSFLEVFDLNLLNILRKNIDIPKSIHYTSRFFGDTQLDHYQIVNPEHHININTNKIEHWIDNSWHRVYHGLLDRKTNVFNPLDSTQVIQKNDKHQLTLSYDTKEYVFCHAIKIMKDIIDFSIPFRTYFIKDQGITFRIMPYKNRKSK